MLVLEAPWPLLAAACRETRVPAWPSLCLSLTHREIDANSARESELRALHRRR